MIFALLISDKLERRHPHVFADSSAENSSEAAARWEQIKTESARRKRSIGAGMIFLVVYRLYAGAKIGERCANVGFDWTTLCPAVDKVYERSTR